MRSSSRQLIFLLFLGALVCNVSTVAAFPHIWFSGTSGAFDDPGRWVPMSVPGGSSDVFFVQPSNYVVAFPEATTVTSNSLAVQGGNVTFEFLDTIDAYAITNDVILGGSGSSSLTVKTGMLEVGGQFDILSGATLVGAPTPNAGTVFVGTALNVANGGAIRGRLDVTSNSGVNNHGLIAPGALPGMGNEIGTINVVGNGGFQQFADGTLEIQIRQAGSASDSLVYVDFGGVGNAILGGRLSVPFINGYVPQSNDSFTFVIAAFPGNTITGQFDSLSVPDLNNGLAARIDYTLTTTSITFVTAATVPFTSTNLLQPPAFNSWDDTTLWNGTVPNSTSVVNVLNQQNYDGEIRVAPNSSAFTHQATLGGLTNSMTLSVPDGTNFTAVDRLTVNNLGVVELVGGGTVHSKLVKVNPGGQIVGNGNIDGDVQLGNTTGTEAAILSPGFSAGEITIEENLTVAQNGQVEIEIFAENDFDKVIVGEDANLGGTLSVDLSNAAPATLIGEEFEVITAGDVNQTFANIEVEGADDYFVQPDYSELSLSLLVWGDGDMNCDGDYTVDDVEKFAMALTNPIAYFSAFEVFGEDSGDMNDDGFFDFDDIDDFSQIDFGGLTADEVVTYLLSQTAAVPEPSAALLAIVACGLVLGSLGRQLCNRSSILD